MADVLLLVATQTDQPDIEARIRTILAASRPNYPDTAPVVFAKPIEELTATDHAALVTLFTEQCVQELRIGSVVGDAA